MTKLNSEQLFKFLNALCDVAQGQTLKYFRKDFEVANKLEGAFDPVTIADRAAEEVIRAMIEKAFPDHGIIGEEYGVTNAQSSVQWVIDPIDGTRAFISGLPLWGTLIGLYVDGTPFAGVMHQPFSDERYICDGSQSVLLHNKKMKTLHCSSVDALSAATLMTTSPKLFEGEEAHVYERLESEVRLARYGADCYAYAMIASGHVDLVVESGLHIYDIAALIPLVEKAGGLMTNWEGGDCSQGGRVLAASNKQLHEQAMKILNA